jgi:hypothetical protein
MSIQDHNGIGLRHSPVALETPRLCPAPAPDAPPSPRPRSSRSCPAGRTALLHTTTAPGLTTQAEPRQPLALWNRITGRLIDAG